MRNKQDAVLYWETSAINRLAEGRTPSDAKATRRLQLFRGRRWCISPVSLWEILLTKNDPKRESLLLFCRHLFGEDLLPTPEELLLDYIKKGCPLQEPAVHHQSSAQISRVWKRLVSNEELTFVYDQKAVQHLATILASIVKELRELSRAALVLPGSRQSLGISQNLHSIVSQLSFLRNRTVEDENSTALYRQALAFLAVTMVCGASLDAQTIQEFWNGVGLQKTCCRFRYVLENHETLVYRGPFVLMALLAHSISEEAFSRGTFLDCLHATYLPYVDMFITADRHFLKFRDALPSNYPPKIFHYDDLSIVDGVSW